MVKVVKILQQIMLPVICLSTFLSPIPVTAQSSVSDPLPYAATYLSKCNAGDAGSDSLSSFTVIDPCTCADDTTTIQFDYGYSATSQTRYDVRLGLTALSGGQPFNVYQSCMSDLITGGANPFSDADRDGDCGDISSGVFSSTVQLTLSCDPFNTGVLPTEFVLTPVLDWAPSARQNKDGQFSGPKCNPGVGGDPSASVSFPGPAGISVGKVSTGGTGAFTIDVANLFDPNYVSSCAGPASSTIVSETLTTTVDGTAVTSAAPYTIFATSSPIVISEPAQSGWNLDGISCTIDGAAVAGSFDEASASLTLPGGTVSPGEELVCIASNSAAATGTPAFSFEKTSDDTFDSINDTVTFDFAVTNSGDVTLSNLTVTDTFFTPSLVCTIATLAPGVTDNTTCSASYVTDQDDLDVGQITNTASLAGESAQGPLTPIDSTAVVSAAPEQASLTIEKLEADGDGKFDVIGTMEGYTFSITNTGLVTLKNITIADPLTGLDCAVADLAPGASTTSCANGDPFAGTYEIKQSDVDAGSVTNVVTVDATTTQGTALSETDQVILSGPVQAPALALVKTATAGADFSAIDDEITYSYSVTNDGNITLTEPITIADDRVSVTCPSLPVGGLLPGGVLVCGSSDRVDQGDLDAGSVVNTATANVSQPVVPSALHPTGRAEVASNEEIVTVLADQDPELTIAKGIKAGTPATYDATTDVVTYEFVVTNSGNVTTTGQITVADVDIPVTVDCGPVGGIAPGASVTCEATWSPDQGDIDAGQFDNNATASMEFGGVTVPSVNTGTATAFAVQQPEMTVVKTYRDGSLGVFAKDEIATYDYLITNTGNQTIVGPVTIEDNLIAAVDCSAFTGDLAPGDTMTCEGDYVVTTTDVQLGSVTNLAKAVSVTAESAPESAIIPEDGVPAMSITKAADLVMFSLTDNVIRYTYEVMNSSTGATLPAFANPIYINDDKFVDPILCWETSTDDPDVRPGETISCFADYTVTQADFDAIRQDPDPAVAVGDLLQSFVKNTASGETQFGTTEVVSDPVAVLVPGEDNPSLLVEKVAASADDPAVVGSTVSYTITVTNDGA